MRDLNGLLLVAFGVCCHPLLIGMGHQLRKVVWLQRVEDVEEIRPRWPLLLWKLVWEVLCKFRIFLELRPGAPHRQLIIGRHGDVPHVILLEELLLLGKDIPQEILRDARLLRQVELS